MTGSELRLDTSMNLRERARLGAGRAREGMRRWHPPGQHGVDNSWGVVEW